MTGQIQLSASRERMLQQLERCVAHQPDGIEPGPVIIAESELYAGVGEMLDPEIVGNGAREPDVDQPGVWGLRPPNDEAVPPLLNTGDWA